MRYPIDMDKLSDVEKAGFDCGLKYALGYVVVMRIKGHELQSIIDSLQGISPVVPNSDMMPDAQLALFREGVKLGWLAAVEIIETLDCLAGVVGSPPCQPESLANWGV